MINGKKVVATIQCRMTSTRLPGKALLPLAGKPVIAHMVERHRRSKFIDEVVVATTTNQQNDPIVEWCKKTDCPYYRGSENDVLQRITEAAKKSSADIVVQGMADSPLVDWRFVDTLIEMLIQGDYDCASNELEESFPLGFDSRIFLFPALSRSERLTQDLTYREHASQYIYQHPQEFRLVNWKASKEMFWPSLRLTLDTPEDYKLISIIFEELYPKNNDFSASDVLAFIKSRPQLAKINSDIKQVIPKIPSDD